MRSRHQRRRGESVAKRRVQGETRTPLVPHLWRAIIVTTAVVVVVVMRRDIREGPLRVVGGANHPFLPRLFVFHFSSPVTASGKKATDFERGENSVRVGTYS
ncbi:hypothetical protein GW17_00044477 [Ensete ventricosum]|nr:hypothetical protein GW17_00044477 [Ensete ventricosum]